MAKVSRFTFHVSRGWVEPALVTLFFVLLTIAMTWPWALRMGEAINPFGDVVVQMTSLRWDAHALVTNPLGLFEAPFFYPYAHSLAFSENLLGQAITALPLLLVTGNPALALNFNILLSFALTGVFTYLLVRDLTGSRAAGLLSGVAFAFCPFRFMQMGHLHLLATEWIPFTLWMLGRGLGVRRQTTDDRRQTMASEPAKDGQGPKSEIRNPKSEIAWAWVAFGFIAMGLSSVYYTYFLAFAVVLYLAWWLVAEVWPGRKWAALGPVLLRPGAAALVVGVMLAPVFLPYAQSGSDLGFSRSTYEVRNWQAEWSFFGNVLQSNWLYGKVLAPAMASAGGERELFPGIVPCVLALVGIVRGTSVSGGGRDRFYYVLLGALSLLLTFGLSAHIPGTSIEVPLPYALLYDWVPGFKALRVPVRFAVLVDLTIYVLAGYGLARFWILDFGFWKRWDSKSKIQNPKYVLSAVLIGLVVLEFVNPLDTDNRRDVVQRLRETEPYGWLSRPENAGPVVELPMTAGQDDVWYTFFGTRHWQPLVNGWSSFVPPGTMYLKRALDSFPDPVSLALLQGLGVRHVVVHLWQFPREAQEDLKERLDKAEQLRMARQDGDNYVYQLADDHWLERVAEQVGDGTLWVGEAREGSLPALEVLAYRLRQLGVHSERTGGNINIGYRPIGTLPFGTPADYALVPNVPGASEPEFAERRSDGAPFGFEGTQEVMRNPAVRLLKRNPALLSSYDMTLPDAPRVSLKDLHLGVGETDVTFGGEVLQGSSNTTRTLDLSFAAFAPSEVAVQVGGHVERVKLPAGVSHYVTPPFDTQQEVTLSQRGGDLRLLRVDLRSDDMEVGEPRRFVTSQSLMLTEIGSSRGESTFDTRLRVVAPRGGRDYTVTLDVYAEPWGTHPEGHFGSWSAVLPADGTAHDYTFHLDPVGKRVTAERDGGPTEVFTGWEGRPTQGDFRAILTVLTESGAVTSDTLYIFTRRGDRVTDWQPEPTRFQVAQSGDSK